MTDEEKKSSDSAEAESDAQNDAETEEAAAPEATAEEEKKEEEAPAVEEKVEEPAPVEEAPVEEKPADAEGSGEAKEVEMTADQKKIIEQIENMTVVELNALVKVFEEKFGVSAAAVAVAGPVAGGDAAEEKSSFTVHLAALGDSKIGVIKVAKEVLGLGLKEAKDLVESAPVDLKSDVKKDDAEEWKTKFEAAGATIELK